MGTVEPGEGIRCKEAPGGGAGESQGPDDSKEGWRMGSVWGHSEGDGEVVGVLVEVERVVVVHFGEVVGQWEESVVVLVL